MIHSKPIPVSCQRSLSAPSSIKVSGGFSRLRERRDADMLQVNSFLSFMFPPEKGQTMSPHSEQWLRMTFRDRTLFHASMFCQLTRNRLFFSSPAESREQMQCYTETIRGVHQKFSDTSMSCEDEN